MSGANGSKPNGSRPSGSPPNGSRPKGSPGVRPPRRPAAGSAAAPSRGVGARLARLLPIAPSGGAQAARTPFVLLVVLLLGGGLIMLLMLNSSLNEGSFRLTKLKKQTTELTDDEQQLQREVDSYSAPDALLRRAHELGMVPGGDPAFLTPSGVRGVPEPAAAPPPVRRPAPSPTPSGSPAAPPSGSPSASGQPSASAPASPKTPQGAAQSPAAPTASAPSTPGR